MDSKSKIANASLYYEKSRQNRVIFTDNLSYPSIEIYDTQDSHARYYIRFSESDSPFGGYILLDDFPLDSGFALQESSCKYVLSNEGNQCIDTIIDGIRRSPKISLVSFMPYNHPYVLKLVNILETNGVATQFIQIDNQKIINLGIERKSVKWDYTMSYPTPFTVGEWQKVDSEKWEFRLYE